MTSAADPTATFLAAIQAANLLTPEQSRDIAAWVATTRADTPGLAKELNRRGWLTPYQIKEIFKGRGRDLVLGRYILLDLLGEGGMGRVFKVHNTHMGRDEALKVIRKERLSHTIAAARFDQEMKALGQVKHPNVVTAFDAGLIGDVHFVAMEFIDGLDLTRLVRERGPLPFPEACEYVRKAALGLHHAYEAGLVHRDIKPSNILVGRDRQTVKLVDLGLARIREAEAEGGNRVTQEGFVIGTPDFLAPEQARDPAGVDIRADIYALGASLFYILSGKVPYDGANPTEKMLKHCTDPPPALLPLRPDVPPQLEQIVHWCMAKRPEDRYQTPMDLAIALQPFCPPSSSGVVPVPTRTPVMPYSAAPAGVSPGYPHPQPTHDPGGASAPQTGFPPGPPVDPDVSNRAFKSASQDVDEDPILQRSRRQFPTGLVLGGCGGLLVLLIVVYFSLFTSRSSREGPLETFTNSVGMKMVKLEGGTFKMGSPSNEPGRPEPRPGYPEDESPVHEVTITGPLLMAATEVTYSQYSRVVGSGPPHSVFIKQASSGSEHPVESVSHQEAMEFCQLLTKKDKDGSHAHPGWSYRLPTEAEWEYACRAGTTTPFGVGTGDRLRYRLQIKDALFTLTGTDPLEDGEPVPTQHLPNRVRQFPANAWGLHDMHGNVAEWCLDWHKRGYAGGDPQDNPLGPASGDRRVVRGGSFRDPASACRSAARVGLPPFERRDTVGFRVVYAPVLK